MRTIATTVVCVALLAASGVAVTARDDPTSRPPVPSAGCGTSEIEAGPELAFMEAGGADRWWVLHVPRAYDGESPVPLVLLFHGLTHSPIVVENQSGFGQLGAEEGFAVMAPAGRGLPPHWMEEDFGEGFIDATRSNRDVVFVEALLDRLEEELCLDLARVYMPRASRTGAR